jgi:hypothetical protein
LPTGTESHGHKAGVSQGMTGKQAADLGEDLPFIAVSSGSNHVLVGDSRAVKVPKIRNKHKSTTTNVAKSGEQRALKATLVSVSSWSGPARCI